MPAMLRPNSKATKILYSILGKPDNMNSKSPYKNKDTEMRLRMENTYSK